MHKTKLDINAKLIKQRETTWLRDYEAAQAKRFTFSNGMSVCEGTDAWHPKYTIKHYLDEATTAEQFIKAVDESIINKLQFDANATDKANLYMHFLSKSASAVDEGSAKPVAVNVLAGAYAKEDNGCYVFESYSPVTIKTMAEALDGVAANIAKASYTDVDGLCSIAVPKQYVDKII